MSNVSLNELRQQIDHIDQNLVQLLKQRMDIVHQVGHIKAKEASGCFLRPAREATMVKKLIDDLKDVYPPQAIYTIWRSIIAASLYQEKPLTIVVLSSDQDAYYLASQYFAGVVPIIQKENLDDVFSFANENPSHIAVVSHSDLWWSNKNLNQLKVFAAIPFLSSSTQPQPKAMALAQINLEKTGDDITLLRLTLSDKAKESNVSSLFSSLNLTYCYQHNNDNYVLVAINGFYADSIESLSHQLIEKSDNYIKNVTLLGCYSKEISLA